MCVNVVYRCTLHIYDSVEANPEGAPDILMFDERKFLSTIRRKTYSSTRQHNSKETGSVGRKVCEAQALTYSKPTCCRLGFKVKV